MAVILKEGKDIFRIIDPFYAGEWEMDNEALESYFHFLKYIETLSFDDTARLHKEEKVADIPEPFRIFIEKGMPLTCDFDIKKVQLFNDSVESGIITPPIPIFEVTPVCNYKCPWCYIPHEKRKQLPLETIKQKLVIPLLKRGTKIFVLSGGEPSLELSRLSEICKLITEEAAKLSTKATILLLTNGYKLGANVKLYKELGISNIQVSVISRNPEINNSLRQVPKGIDSTEEAFLGTQLAVNEGIGVSFNFVLLPEINGIPSNINEIPEMVDYAKQLGVYLIRIVPVVPSGEASKNKIALNLNELKMARNLIEQAIKKYSKDLIVYSPIGYDVPPNKPVYCRAGNDVIYINAEGWTYPCNNLIFSEFLCDDMPLGQSDILEIWDKSVLLKRFRSPGKICHTCFNCNLRTECGGQCRAQIYWRYKQIDLSHCPDECYIQKGSN